MFASNTAYKSRTGTNLFRNWEANIEAVRIERCGPEEDPLGYRAVFFLEKHAAQENRRKTFAVGASFLGQREKNLEKAGYAAPMTGRAIALIEKELGHRL